MKQNASRARDRARDRGASADRRRLNANARGYDRRWRNAARVFLARNPLCVACLRAGRTTPAGVVDHVIPHRGDAALFWTEANWQALCKTCHDRKTLTQDAKESNRWERR